MSPTCCVCSQPFDTGRSFEITAEEKAAFPPGDDIPERVHYCSSCLRIMEDREAGAQLLKGLYEMQLRQRGVRNAKQLAETFHASLLKNTSKKLH